MEMGKIFTLSTESPQIQRIIISPTLGRILFRPEIKEIVESFNSSLEKEGVSSIKIIPPISEEKLPELGERLVRLEQNISPDTPPASYMVTGLTRTLKRK